MLYIDPLPGTPKCPCEGADTPCNQEKKMTQMDTQKNDRVRPQGRRTARTLILAALAVLVLGSFTTLRAFQNRDDGRDANGRDDERERYAIGLWGDLPYSDVQAQVGVPNLIADMNSQELAFTVHDGDLKAGNGTPGSRSRPPPALTRYIPRRLGSSTRCARRPSLPPATMTGPTVTGRPTAALIHVSAWTTNASSSSAHRLRSASIASARRCSPRRSVLAFTGPTPCVENRRWNLGGVTYASLNVQGSCNNLCDTAPDPPEFAARNAANIQWLHDTFAEARARGSVAGDVLTHAPPRLGPAAGPPPPPPRPPKPGGPDRRPSRVPA